MILISITNSVCMFVDSLLTFNNRICEVIFGVVTLDDAAKTPNRSQHIHRDLGKDQHQSDAIIGKVIKMRALKGQCCLLTSSTAAVQRVDEPSCR